MQGIVMQRHSGALAAMAVIGLIGAGCGPSDSPAPVASSSASSGPVATSTPSAVSGSALPLASPSAEAIVRNPAAFVEGAPYAVRIDPADFVAVIDNPYMPLTPGTTMTFDGDEQITVHVETATKLILGVATTVVRDQVFADGELAEDTLDWYAQDQHGNVWYFGEKTAEYENGEVVSTAGSWEGGVDGALPGIIMLADPRAGDVYRQEYYAGEAEDLAEIIGPGGSIAVPFGTFDDLLVTEEWTPLEPDVRERKTYARGVGLVESRQIKGGEDVVQLEEVKTGS